MITYIKMIVMSSSKRIQTLFGHFYAVLFAIIVFKKYPPTYLSSMSQGGQLKTGLNLVEGQNRNFFVLVNIVRFLPVCALCR